MTYDQYWYGDTWMVRTFREADRLRQKRINEEAWLIGSYVRFAVDSTICNAFRDSKKGQQMVKYPPGPIGNDDDERNQKKKSEEAEAAYAKAYMEQMMRAGQNWGKRNGSESD